MDQAFKLLITTKPGVQFMAAQHLIVEQFNERRRKPFVGIDGSIVYSGACG